MAYVEQFVGSVKPSIGAGSLVFCKTLMTESTGHLSEYLPYFRKSQKALDIYCDEPSFGGEIGAYYKYCADLAEKFSAMDPLSIETRELQLRSAKYASHIIEACETGEAFRFSANLRNGGYITNLPQGCCVEVPTCADRLGLHPTRVGICRDRHEMGIGLRGRKIVDRPPRTEASVRGGTSFG